MEEKTLESFSLYFSESSLVASHKGLLQNILIENQREGVIKFQGTFWVPESECGAGLTGAGTPELRASWQPTLCSAPWFLFCSHAFALFLSLCKSAFMSSLCLWLPQSSQVYMSLIQVSSHHLHPSLNTKL